MKVVPARVPGTTVTHLARIPDGLDDEALGLEWTTGLIRLRPICPDGEMVEQLEPVPETDGQRCSWCPECKRWLDAAFGVD